MRTRVPNIIERRCRSQNEPCDDARCDEGGFTLVEMLAVLAIFALGAVAVSTVSLKGTDRVELRAATLRIASRIRDVRTAAILSQRQRLFYMDVDRRLFWANDGGPALQLGRGIHLTVTSAGSASRGPSQAGMRFLPNGSSTGGTISLSHGQHAAEIRVSWLTGRVTHRELR